MDELFDVGEGPVGGAGERRPAEVNALALQPDGRVIVGGRFTSFNGRACDGVVRLNPDGSIDESFRLGTGQPTDVRALLLEPDGKILTAGSFAKFDGVERRGVARLNSDGSRDDTFEPRLDSAGIVRALALQPDGRILVGGALINLLYEQVIRLQADGSIDESFRPPSFGHVLALLLLQNGQLLVGEQGGPVIRLNSDGSRDLSFQGGAFLGQTVHCLAELPDGKILVGGLFTDPNTDPDYYTGVIRLTSSGVRDPTFVLATRTRWPPVLVRTLSLQAGDNVFLGGTFGGNDDEEIALARRAPTFGVANISRQPGAYHWLRLGPDGGPVNDLHFDRLVRLPDGMVHVSLAGQGRAGFRLEASDDLRVWSTFATNFAPNAGLAWLDGSATNAHQRFYRTH